jgi:hypothetical protein
MKKIFTLIAVAVMAISANAQTWNFSDWEEQTFSKGEEKTINGLTINPSSKDIVIDANNKTVDDVKYTKRLKFGGKGSATDQNVYFTASGAGTLKIILTSASGSEDRKLGVALDGTELGQLDAIGGTATAATINITGAGKVAIYGLGGVNLYCIEFSTSSGIKSPTGETKEDSTLYNLSGQQVNEAYRGVVVKNGKKMIQK